MRAHVVYESMFGNTEEIARAVADGMRGRLDVEVRPVTSARPEQRVDLIVAGGPTHAFSLSRSSTRADAVTQGASRGTEDVGLREWLTDLPAAADGQSFAAFDTKVDKMRHLPGSAASKAARMARRLGYAAAGHDSFYVSGTAGPLVEGELDRARQWGAQLAAHMADQAAAQTN